MVILKGLQNVRLQGQTGSGRIDTPQPATPDAMAEVHAHEWAKNDLNTLVKTAQDRRQNFTDAHAEAILGWNRKRKDGAGELKALFGVK